MSSDETTSDTLTASRSTAEGFVPEKSPMELLIKSGAGVLLPKKGELVEGTVMEKKGSRMFIDLGARGIGIVYGREYYAAQDIIKSLEIGQDTNTKVIDIDNDEGYIELSLKEAGEEKRWVDIKRAMHSAEVLSLPVLEANRGGLILEYKAVKGFLPASQLSYKHYPRVEGGDKERIYQELQKLVGTPLKVKILDVNPEEMKLIFTEKGSNPEEVQEILSQFKTGDIVEGEITGVVDFGAFMKLTNELEGLIHISEIDWSLVENPRDVLTPGDKIKAKIIDIQGDKISLSLKALKDDPWQKIAEKYKAGDAIKGTVKKFNPFGAFVQLEGEEIQGLVHVSEFGSESKMHDFLQLEKEYPFTILLIDPKEHRVSLRPVGIKKEEKESSAAETVGEK